MPIGAVIVEFFSGIADAWRARRALKAQADMQLGADILNKAIREDAEMKAAVEAMEARKRLDSTLSSTPIVPALPTIQPAPLPAVAAQPGAQPVPVPSPAPAEPKPVAQPVQPAAPAAAAAPSVPAASAPVVASAAPVAPASSSNVNYEVPMPGDVSPHFSLHEFGLSDEKARKRGLAAGAEYPAEWIESRLKPLCAALEIIRAEFGGKPIRIVSAYRPLEYNRKLGSKDDSQHVVGRAADFQIPGVEPKTIWDRMLALRHVGRIEIGGAGVYDEFCHVDVRGGAMAMWDERKK